MQLATLRKPDGTFTADLNETLKVMRDYFIPNDEHNDTDYHKTIRAKLNEPILTEDDRDCTSAEVKNAIDE